MESAPTDPARAAIQAERAARYAREMSITRRYEHTARVHLVLALAAVALSASPVFDAPVLARWGWWLAATASGAYLYFVNRYLENLGTRYDLLPIVTRSRRFDSLANRPILFHVFASAVFYAAWLAMLVA